VEIRHLIVDRDGVLNREDTDGGWVCSAEEWRWESGALAGLQLFTEAGVRISVVTNQSCIGRGLASPEVVATVHDHMRREAEACGARIEAVFVCPHAPEDGCDCRKPQPGLVRQAVESSGLSRTQTVLVGDARRDLEAGLRCGVKVVLVRTGKGTATEESLHDERIPVYDDLRSAAIDLLGTE
jgi:D-glycero-D-manno-heptose 1,7-bisphosphate phosphatase